MKFLEKGVVMDKTINDTGKMSFCTTLPIYKCARSLSDFARLYYSSVELDKYEWKRYDEPHEVSGFAKPRDKVTLEYIPYRKKSIVSGFAKPRKSKQPLVYFSRSVVASIEYVCKAVKKIHKIDKTSNICIIYRKESQAEDIKKLQETMTSFGIIYDDEKIETIAGRIIFLTPENAKGMEFDTVIIFGADEGTFPAKTGSDISDLALNEERSLFLFSLISAKKELIIVSNTSEPSRFIGEIGLDKTRKIIGDPKAYNCLVKSTKTFCINKLASLENSSDGHDIQNREFLESTIANQDTLLSLDEIIKVQKRCGRHSFYFHMTPIENLNRIIKGGYMYSRNMLDSFSDTERSYLADSRIMGWSENHGIRSFKRDGEVYESGTIHDFVRNYMTVKNAMSYRIGKIERKEYVIIVLSPYILMYGGWRFADKNAASTDETVNYYASIGDLKNIDWEEIYQGTWNGNERRKKKMQAEFQVKDEIPVELIQDVIVKTNSEYNSVKKMVATTQTEIDVIESKAWFW
jgi:hypothetical protein